MGYGIRGRLWIAVVFMLVGGATAQAACPPDGCLVQQLHMANDDLNRVYGQLAESLDTPSRSKLRMDQRAWIRARDAACASRLAGNSMEEWLNHVAADEARAHCVLTRTRTRTALLGDRITAAGGIAPLPEERARQICAETLDLLNTGQLKARIVRGSRAPTLQEKAAWKDPFTWLGSIQEIDYRRNGTVHRLAQRMSMGTCSSGDLVDLDRIGPPLPDYPYIGVGPDQMNLDEDLRWVSWGGVDSFAFIAGEPVIVTGDLDGDGDATLVSWFGEGAKRPLCTLKRTGQLASHPLVQRNPKLCAAFVKGQVAPVTWGPLVPVVPLRVMDCNLIDARLTPADLNEDGIEESVAPTGCSSGAGCGGDFMWLAVYTADWRYVRDAPLNQLLDQASRWRGYDPPWPAPWADTSLFLFEGQPYFTGLTGTVARVSSVWKNTLEEWCTFDLLPQHQIGKYIPYMSP